MKKSTPELNKVVKDIQAGLFLRFPFLCGWSVAHAQDVAGESDAYCYVNIFNVPEDKLLEVEDVAYSLWQESRHNAGLSVCFFLHTPEETAKKFPAYSMQWVDAHPLLPTDRTYHISSLDLGKICGLGGGTDGVLDLSQWFSEGQEDPNDEQFRSVDRQDIAANNEMAKAA